MPESTIAYLDCSMGLTEEMLLGALCDCGLDIEEIMTALASSPLNGFSLEQESVRPATNVGISGTRLAIIVDEAAIDWDEQTEEFHKQIKKARKQTQDLSYTDIKAIIGKIDLDERSRERVSAMVHWLMKAQATITRKHEANIRWTKQETVHMLIAMCATVLSFARLHFTQLFVSALPLPTERALERQSDQVSDALVMELLRQTGGRWHAHSMQGARVTPLAAAIIAELASFQLPEMVFQRIGYGFAPDAQNPEQRFVRLCIGEAQTEQVVEVKDMDEDRVVVIESNIDNMTGELLGALLERLLALGALDVNYTAIQMKKDRPATMLSVICREGDEERFARMLLRETTTLGVRIQPMRRLKAQREQVQIETDLGPMLVKVKRLGTSFVSASPEYEECQRAAKMYNIPLIDVYEIVREAISKASAQGILKREA